MTLLFEIAISPPKDGAGTDAKDLYRQLREAIADGRLPAGAKLPPTRKSATYFGASRNTMVQVYERLISGGYVTARHGSGTYVASLAHRSPAAASSADPPNRDFPLNTFWRRPEVEAAIGFWQDRKGALSKPARVDFRPALVDPRTFPLALFRKISARQLRSLENRPPSFKSPQGNAGNHSLRTAIVSHIGVTRAVVARPDEVIVTSGAQQAFDLLARTLVGDETTVVAVEDPGYPPLGVAFAAAGARVVPVPVDQEGIVVDRLPDNTRIICVTPSHQFPLGVTLSLNRRRALLEFARTRKAVIVEDDYDGEFRFSGAAVEALRTADAADVVFYVGTFSKCMLPSLRLGFMVTPSWAHSTLVAAKNCMDWHCSTPVQMSVASFVADGCLNRHVRKMRLIYQQRREFLMHELERKLGHWLCAIPSHYGMHITAATRPGLGVDLEAIADLAADQRVKVHTLSRYFRDKAHLRGLVLGYGATDIDEIAAGVAVLTEAFQTISPSK